MTTQPIYNIALIDKYLIEHKMSKYALCKSSDTPYSTLRCMYEQKTTCRIHNVAKIVFFMGYQLKDIFVK